MSSKTATQTSGKEMAPQQQQQAAPLAANGRDLAPLLESLRPQVARVITDPKFVDRFLRVALTELRTKPDLQKCTQESILASLMQAAQLNLEVGGSLRQGYLIPYKNECQFMPSYIGFLTLLRRSRQFRTIDTALVGERDVFSFERDPAPKLYHKPDLWTPGAYLGAYVYAVLANGEPKFLAMNVLEIEKARAQSRAPNSLMWASFWGEGAQKTVVRRFSKTQELTPELALALELDDREYVKQQTAIAPQFREPAGLGQSRSAALAQRLQRGIPSPEEMEGIHAAVESEGTPEPDLYAEEGGAAN